MIVEPPVVFVVDDDLCARLFCKLLWQPQQPAQSLDRSGTPQTLTVLARRVVGCALAVASGKKASESVGEPAFTLMFRSPIVPAKSSFVFCLEILWLLDSVPKPRQRGRAGEDCLWQSTYFCCGGSPATGSSTKYGGFV